jgi:predicted nucleic acid-binding protein
MLFLDTYAMVEYFKGNPAVARLIENNNFCTSDFQLMELYYITLREQDENSANAYFETFALMKAPVMEKTIKNAMKLRLELQRQRKNISYVDALGYQYSLEHKLRFVTGDRHFKGLKSVEFIN